MNINLSETIWTIVNLLLLMLLLRIFLYSKLIKFRDERAARVREALAEGEKAWQSGEENDKILDQELQRSISDARQILSQAKTSGEREKREILNRANEQALRIRGTINQRIADEEESVRKNTADNIPKLVSVLVSHILEESKATM